MKKITYLISLFLLMVGTAVAETTEAQEPQVITSLDQLSNYKAYILVTQRSSLAVNASGTQFGTAVDLQISFDSANDQFQFAILKDAKGQYYLYSIKASKFVTKTGALSKKPSEPISFTNGKWEGTFTLYFDMKHFININNYKKLVINDWGVTDEGNSFTITAVDDFEPSDELLSSSSYVKWDYCGQDEDASCGMLVGCGDNDIEYAMRIPAGQIAAYKGCQITAIEYYTSLSLVDYENNKYNDRGVIRYVFITSPGIDYLVRQSVSGIRGGWMRVELDQPYTITGDEVFVGIGKHGALEFHWANFDGGEDVCWTRVMGTDTQWPVRGVWVNESPEYRNPLPIRAIIRGENLPTDVAIAKTEIIDNSNESWQAKRKTESIVPIVPRAKVVEELPQNGIFSYITDGERNYYAAPVFDSPICAQSTAGQKVRMKLLNRTQRVVRQVTFDWSIDGQKQEPYPAETFILPNYYGFVCMDLPDDIVGRNHNVDINVGEIDSIPDEIAENSQIEFLYTINSSVLSYPRKIVMEEAAGTWCGYCPRGMVAIENMYKRYPDNFIAIAIHGGDEMYPQGGSYDSFLEVAPSLPNCQINRISWMKPESFGWSDLARMKDKGMAMIRAHAAFASENKVEVNTETVFGFDDNGTTEYRIAYVVVEDKVGPYSQENYYSNPNAADNPSDLLNWWIHQGSSVDMLFNDVARAIYDYDGIAGQLPREIEAEKTYTCSYTLTLPDNIQNAENLRIVTLLLDTTTGEILNADSTPIDGTPGTAIEDVTLRQPGVYDIYNVSGVKVRQQATSTHGLSKGIYIINGRKVVIK